MARIDDLLVRQTDSVLVALALAMDYCKQREEEDHLRMLISDRLKELGLVPQDAPG